MALNKSNIKKGMDGSHSGKGRYEKTEILKHDSKHRRRIEDKQEYEQQLNDICLDVQQNKLRKQHVHKQFNKPDPHK